MIVVRRAGVSGTAFMDAVAPGPAARAGDRPDRQLVEPGALRQADDLPWGLKIDPAHQASLPGQYVGAQAYHPTFLYELIWDLAGVALLLWLDRRYTFRPPALFALYVSYYCFGRFFEELLRIDPSHHFAGLRINAWVSVVLFVGSTGVLHLVAAARTRRLGPRGRRRRRGRGRSPTPPRPKMAVPKGRVR